MLNKQTKKLLSFFWTNYKTKKINIKSKAKTGHQQWIKNPLKYNPRAKKRHRVRTKKKKCLLSYINKLPYKESTFQKERKRKIGKQEGKKLSTKSSPKMIQIM